MMKKESKEFEIEDGIPPPTPEQKEGKWINLARRMKVKQSVLLDTKNDLYAMSNAISRSYGEGSFATEKDKETGKFRIWRLK